jgi:polysaccharide deacetylase 2 family uncharacterized protein YibQ
VSRAATVFWSAILSGSVVAIGAGFLGGRSVGQRALTPPRPRGAAPAPAAIAPRDLVRALRGAGSFDPGSDDPDPYGDADLAVAARPNGWAPRDPDAMRPRIALVVVDADRDATALQPFLAAQIPLAVLVAPDDANDTLRLVGEAGKTALVACAHADPASVASLRRAGAAGIACSTDNLARARLLVAVDGDGIVLDDLESDDDALYRAARAAHRPVLTRDVVVDARDEPAYVDFLFDQGLAIARRTGVATIALHARASSLRALERFVGRARRADVELVEVRALGS